MKSWRDYVTDDTKIMLSELKEKHKNIHELTTKRSFYSNIAGASVVLLIIYALFFIWNQSQESILFVVSNFLGNYVHLIWIIITGYFYFMKSHYQSLIKDEKLLLESLRVEMIDHLKNTWYINKYSYIRDEISKELAGEEIDLRYKSR